MIVYCKNTAFTWWERLPAAINDGSMVLRNIRGWKPLPPGKSRILAIKCHFSVISVSRAGLKLNTDT
jgi:hypothetical protein